MPRTASASTVIAAGDVDRAIAAWQDVDRWPQFVEGCARIVERDPGWPTPGSWVVWRSPSGGRGTVREEVLAAVAGSFVTRTVDPSLVGTQTLAAEDDGDGGLALVLTLDYELVDASLFQAAMDALFIRRALRDSLRRTLDRFAAEIAASQGA